MQWRFGRFRLDREHACLWEGEHRLALRPKTFELLLYMVTHAGELVRKETLLEAVWPDTAVTEGVLTTSLGELRKVLGETAKQPQYIATVPRRGYRFIAPVTPLAPAEAETRQRVPPQATGLLSVNVLPDALLPRPILVERETELTQLHRCFQRACQGHRQVVFVSGEAGIGKTTLVDAFLTQLATYQPLQIGRGQCLDHYGAGEAYLPLLEALGQMGQGAQGADVIDVLRQHAPGWLLQLPALWSTDELPMLQQRVLGATRERMLRELAEAVEALAHDRPLVFVLEDLHWSDVSTLDWLGYIARRRALARLLVLGTYRPVDAVVREHPIRAVTQELHVHGQCVELLLPYVSEAGVTVYLEQRCGAAVCSPALVRALHQRTHGNPLFFVTVVEEMWRQGRFREHETGREGQARNATTILGDIPESLRHLIERQLEQLPPEDRACLGVASVAGREFSTAAVAAVTADSLEAIDVRLAALARRGQFVHPCGIETWPDGTMAARYGFTHDLYHEIVYERVPLSSRTRHHQQIGIRLEAGYGVRAREIAAELAAHFVHGRDPGRAVHYLQYTAETALQRSASQEAIAHLRQGLELIRMLPDTPERAQQELRFHTTLGPVLMATKGYGHPDVVHTYARARELCHQVGETPQHFLVLWGLWMLAYSSAQYQTALELGAQLLAVAHQSSDPTLVLQAHHTLWTTSFHCGAFTAVQEHVQYGLEHYTSQHSQVYSSRYGGHDPGVCCRHFAALTLWALGWPDQAVQRSDEALALARELSHPFSLAYALQGEAMLHQLRQDVALTHERAEAALALATRHGFQYIAAECIILRGWALAMQGQGGTGIAQIRQGLDAIRATGAEHLQPWYRAVLAAAYGHIGQVEAGLATLTDALAGVDTTGERAREAELYRLRGELLLQQDVPDATRAEACFRHALDLARYQQAKSWELQAAVSLSRLWQQQGKYAAAHQLLAEVYDWFTEGFDTADLQKARTLLEDLARGATAAPS